MGYWIWHKMNNASSQDDKQQSRPKKPSPRDSRVAAGESLHQIADLIHKAGIRLRSQDPSSSAPVQETQEPTPSPPEKSSEFTEDELFKSAMNDVHPALWRHSPHPASQPQPIITGNPEMEDRKLMQAAIEGTLPETIMDHPEYIEGWIGVAGKRFLPNLRNGRYSLQGQIDLHGLNQAEAQIAVEDYIIRMSRFGSCCIKIIHGRGMNSPTDRATLKESLQRFLATRRMSRYVVAYASAATRDGGVGAVYVLLSRQ
jgi:DNA-nicking Smr family endonuclease